MDGYQKRIIRNIPFEVTNNSVYENKMYSSLPKWSVKNSTTKSLKQNQLKLLSSIDDVLQNECQAPQQHMPLLNQHKHALDHTFSTQVHLITLTADILSDFLTNKNAGKKDSKNIKSKKESKSKPNKNENSRNDFSDKKTKKFNSGTSDSLTALEPAIRGMMKNIASIQSTWLVYEGDKDDTRLAFERQIDDSDNDIIALKHFEKDVRKLTKDLSKHLYHSPKHQCHNKESVILSEIIWTEPFKPCSHVSQWFVSLYILFRRCSTIDRKSISGFMEVVIDLKSIDVYQCSSDPTKACSGTHKCPQNSDCRKISGYGLRDGGYSCECKPGYTSMEKEDDAFKEGQCVKCEREKCGVCEGGWCLEMDVPYSVVVILFIIHIIVMVSIVIPGAFIVRLRRIKSMQFSFWQLYEVMIFGALLMYTSVLLEYLDTHAFACSMVPWNRELGFLLLYASLMLKIHRISVESKSRQAQRTFLRDKDLVKYLAILVALLSWQLVAWSLMQMEGVVVGGLGISMQQAFCHVGYWHLTMQIVEFLFLSWVFYLCLHLKPPPSFLIESRVITFIVANEALVSASFNAARYFLESSLSKNATLTMSFCRCHLTVTFNLLVILATKLWQARAVANNVVSLRGRKEGGGKDQVKAEGKQVGKPVAHENLKNQLSNVSKKSQESNEMTIAGLNPEDVKTELRRLYRQLEIYKGKTAKKEVCHVSKKQPVPKKQGPRRFSLHNFHTRHKHQVAEKAPEETADCGHDVIKTEEPSISAELLSASPSAM